MKDERIDNWLRESLDNYQLKPSEASKNKFLLEISGTSSSVNNRTLIILFIIFMLISASGIILSGNLNNQVIKNRFAANNKNITQKISKIPFTKKSIASRNSRYRTTAEPIRDEEASNVSFYSTNGSVKEDVFNQPEGNVIRKDESLDDIVNILLDNEKSYTIEDPAVYSRSLGNNTFLVYYRPEMLYNVIENEKLVHNFGLSYQTKVFNNNYIIGTGLGLSVTTGYYEYAVKYNEYLGNYQHLDSVTFDWNPSRFSMQHTLHTTDESVYDTTITTQYEKVYRNFVYLQVPFTLGYEFLNSEKYSIGLRFEPVLSILLSKKPEEYKYETGVNRLIQINRITADRVKTNWQLNAGLCMGTSMLKRIRVELEPQVTYYFNSVYEKSDNSSSPVGASIRVAVGFKY